MATQDFGKYFKNNEYVNIKCTGNHADENAPKWRLNEAQLLASLMKNIYYPLCIPGELIAKAT